MPDKSKQIIAQLEALAAQAQNYRYAGAAQRLNEICQMMQVTVTESKTPQSK